MERRNTVQRSMVLNAVKQLKKHATADEVYEQVIKEHPNIGKGTVYRNLNILAENGDVRKVCVPGGADRFDHTTIEHFHGECEQCGDVFDIDMDIFPDIKNNIYNMEGKRFLVKDIIFRGICPKCRDEGNFKEEE